MEIRINYIDTKTLLKYYRNYRVNVTRNTNFRPKGLFIVIT